MKNHTQIDAMKRIRETYPDTPQRTLARMVSNPVLLSDEFRWVPYSIRMDVFRLTTRFATNYNRIRRIDGSIR